MTSMAGNYLSAPRSGAWSRRSSATLGDAQQRHGAGHLAREDVGGPLHASLAPGHQAVEVGAARPGPRGRRGPTAATTSPPDRMPPSTYTSARSPTASTTAGSSSSGVGARSSWRPPWLETTTASAPASTTRAGVVDGLDALDDQRAVPDASAATPGRRSSRPDRTSWSISSATVPSKLVERGELERLGRQQVEPPAGVQCALGEGAQATAPAGWSGRCARRAAAAPATGVSTVSTSAS